jgi:hypothetical protein
MDSSPIHMPAAIRFTDEGYPLFPLALKALEGLPLAPSGMMAGAKFMARLCQLSG